MVRMRTALVLLALSMPLPGADLKAEVATTVSFTEHACTWESPNVFKYCFS